MDELGNLTSGENAALVILAFLQADCGNPEYGKELVSLRENIIHPTLDINCNGLETLDDGDLECDGHISSSITASIDDILPSVALHLQRNRDEDGAVLQVAEGLREIAAQLGHNVVALATQNLGRKILASPADQWKEHLSREVERVMRQGVGLDHLPQERVFMAVTLTLLRGVCEQAPRVLRNLFNIALQYIRPVIRSQ